MKYINLMGSMPDLDRVIEKYVVRSEIQLEYASKELVNEKEFYGFPYKNPYTSALKSAEKLFKLSGLKPFDTAPDMDADEAQEYIVTAEAQVEILSQDIKSLTEKREKYVKLLETLESFLDLDFNIYDIKDFEFIKYRFGKMPLASFKQFETYLYHEPEILIAFGKNDKEYVWGVYFVCDYLLDKYESVFSSLHFEKMDFPFEFEGDIFKGTPKTVYQQYSVLLADLEREIARMEALMMEQAEKSSDNVIDRRKISAAYHKIRELYTCYDLRKYAAKTRNDYFILVGWMTEKNARALEKKAEDDDHVVFINEEDNDFIKSNPPTMLKNLPFVKPFEFFVKMYGLPSYDEIDPTPFVALSYTLLYGVMFGDLGQGLVLSMIGLYLSKFRKMALGSVMFIIGLSAAFFGLMFGSAFGMEFHPILLSPAQPDNINILLIGAIVIGVAVILSAMIVNIANGVRKKRILDICFAPSGFAGLTLYGFVLCAALLILLKVIKFSSVLLLIGAVPLLLIGLRHPITKLIRGEKDLIHGSLGMFVFETILEMFEAVLGFFTNTISFVRVGAFALSHAALMGVVHMLANDGKNVVVMILGNILVMGLEGLIVGIQVLRLEFYEIFSRFYDGRGREFTPFSSGNQY